MWLAPKTDSNKSNGAPIYVSDSPNTSVLIANSLTQPTADQTFIHKASNAPSPMVQADLGSRSADEFEKEVTKLKPAKRPVQKLWDYAV